MVGAVSRLQEARPEEHHDAHLPAGHDATSGDSDALRSRAEAVHRALRRREGIESRGRSARIPRKAAKSDGMLR